MQKTFLNVEAARSYLWRFAEESGFIRREKARLGIFGKRTEDRLRWQIAEQFGVGRFPREEKGVPWMMNICHGLPMRSSGG